MTPELDYLLELQRGGAGRDEILNAMKTRDLTIIEAIKASMQLFGVGLGDAKAIVTSHPAWSPIARAAIPLHDAIIQVFRDAGDTVESREAAPTNSEVISDPRSDR